MVFNRYSFNLYWASDILDIVLLAGEPMNKGLETATNESVGIQKVTYTTERQVILSFDEIMTITKFGLELMAKHPEWLTPTRRGR